MSANAIHSDEGDGVAVVDRDLTFELLTAIMANMAEGVKLVSVTTGNIVYTNATYDRLLGYAPGELIGCHVSLVNADSGQDPVEVARTIIGELERTGAWRGEVRNRRKDGVEIWVRAAVTRFHHPLFGDVWLNVNDDITEYKTTQRMLNEAHEARHQLASHTLTVIEQEREETARDIHDSLGATLVGIALKSAAVARRLAGPADQPRRDALADIAAMAKAGQGRIREICNRLHPSDLVDLGLADTLRLYARDWGRIHQIDVRCRCARQGPQPGKAASTALFRIFQELLTNVARHAGASRVQVHFSRRHQGFWLRVADNGGGGVPDRSPYGFGLRGVRERLLPYHGKMTVKSTSAGSVVMVMVSGVPE